MVSTAATVTDAGVGCVATGRGGGDLCLRGREWITGEGGGLGRRRERAVRQVMFRALVTVSVRAGGGITGGFILISSVDRLLVRKKEAAAIALLPGIRRGLDGRRGAGGV